MIDTCGVVSNVVPCYGISQDPETKNFMMVMEYIGDNISQYLKNYYNYLNLYEDPEIYI